MASFTNAALNKFKQLEQTSKESKENLLPPAKRQRRKFVTDFASKFEKPEILEEKKKKEDAERAVFLKQAREKQAREDEERRILEEQRRKEMEEQMERERVEEEKRLLAEAAEKRRIDRMKERQLQMEEDEKRYANMKPAQAIFEKAKAAREAKNNKDGEKQGERKASKTGAVSDMQRKLFQEKEDFDTWLKKESQKMIEKKRREDDDDDKSSVFSKSSMSSKRNSADLDSVLISSPDVYTKGACSNIKSKFEFEIAQKKGLIPSEQAPLKPRKKSVTSTGLPNMFAQQQKREAEMHLKKSIVKENIPMDKKLFNNFLGKFDDEKSIQEAKMQRYKLTAKQKQYSGKDDMTWTQREQAKKKAQEIARQKAIEEEEQRRKELERIRKEQEERIRIEIERKRIEEEEEQKRLQEEREKKKKTKAKKNKDTKKVAPKDLPTIQNTSYHDVKNKLQETIQKKKNPENNCDNPTVKPIPNIGKLTINPFEKKEHNKPETKAVVTVKRDTFMDLKKRYNNMINNGNERYLERNSRSKSLKESDCSKKLVPRKFSEEEKVVKKSSREEKKGLLIIEDENKEEDHRKSIIFRSKDKIMASKEKLVRISRDKLNEIRSSKQSLHGDTLEKPSQSDMKNYLLSQVLFDGRKSIKVPEPEVILELEEDTEPVILDDEYTRDMKRYLALFDEEKKSKKKKKKATNSENKAIKTKLNSVEINSIKSQFEKKKIEKAEETKMTDIPTLKSEEKVGKFKELFEIQTKQTIKEPKKPMIQRGRPKLLSNDLLSKFDSPEMVEVLKKQKEKERAERRAKKEAERLRKIEEEKIRLEQERLEAIQREEERLEQERLEREKREEEERLERERKAEEERAQKAYNEMLEKEKKKAELRGKKEALMKNKREKNEPALRSKKVLSRIQHIFEKANDTENEEKPIHIGSIMDKAGELEELLKEENNNRKSFQDSSLAGVSTVLNKFKNKFENQEEEKPILLGKVQRKKVIIPAAETFHVNEICQNNEELLSPKPKTEVKEWSWKKKDPKELAAETSIKLYGSTKPESEKKVKKKSKTEREDSLNNVEDLLKKNGRDIEKEQEEKMKEYAQFMDEIKGYLQQPAENLEESGYKDDIQKYISLLENEPKKKKKTSKTKRAKETDLTICSVGDLKDRLRSNISGFDRSTKQAQLDVSTSVSQLRKNLFEQDNEKSKENLQMTRSKGGLEKFKSLFEKDDESPSPETVKVKKKLIYLGKPQEDAAKEEKKEKATYEWKYKKKKIEDLQAFMSDNKRLIPSNIESKLNTVKKNLDTKPPQMVEKSQLEDKEVEEYSSFMEEVDNFLTEPDRNDDEVNFKNEIELYLDLIDEPHVKIKKSLKGKNKVETKSVKKLSGSKLKFLSVDDSYSSNTPDETPSPAPDKSFISDIRQRLLIESQKKPEKADLTIHNAGTSQLKHTYEKLSKEEEVILIGPRRRQLQMVDFGPADGGIKSLEEIKAERAEKSWKWREKDAKDLQAYLKSYDDVAPKELMEKERELQKKNEELKKLEMIEHKTAIDVEKILKAREEKDKEFESFLDEIRNCIETPASTVDDADFREGMQNYLTLVEDSGTKLKKKKAKSVTQQRQVPQVKVSLAALKEKLTEKVEGNKTDYEKEEVKIGKVDHSFLFADNEKYQKTTDIEIPGAVNALRMKDQYEKYSREEEKELIKQSKRKLIDTSMFESFPENEHQMKIVKQEREWKWKQKKIDDLETFMNKHKELVPESLKKVDEAPYKEKYEKAERDFQKDLQKKDEENEKFLQDVQNFLNDPSKSKEEDEFKESIHIYLDLLDTPKEKSKPSLYEPKSKPSLSSNTTVKVSNIKKNMMEQISLKSDYKQERQVGKLDIMLDVGTGDNKKYSQNDAQMFADLGSCDYVKRKLRSSQNDSETKQLFSAPKMKMKFVPEKQNEPQIKAPTKKWVMPKSKEMFPLQKQFSMPEVRKPVAKRPEIKVEESYSHIEDPEERRAAILAKYGCKPRPIRRDSSSSSESDSSDEDYSDPRKFMSETELKAIYGDRVLNERKKSPPKNESSGSVMSLLNLLGKVRQTKMVQQFSSTKDKFMHLESSQENLCQEKKSLSELNLAELKGSCSNIKEMFKTGAVFRQHEKSENEELGLLTKSVSCTNVKNLFESGSLYNQEVRKSIDDEDVTRPKGTVRGTAKALVERGRSMVRRATSKENIATGSKMSVSLHRNEFERKRIKDASDDAWKRNLSLERSSSFNKFKDAFEKGNFSDDSDDEYVKPNKKSQVQMELEELKSSTRLQNLMRINKPKGRPDRPSLLSKSKTLPESLDLDEETLEEVSKTKSAIKNMFESSAPKITFGGTGNSPLMKSDSDSSAASPKTQARRIRGSKTVHEDFSNRKWVFDTINKYFDVIKEEEEEEDDSEYESANDKSRSTSMVSSQVSLNTSMISSVRSSMAISANPSAVSIPQYDNQSLGRNDEDYDEDDDIDESSEDDIDESEEDDDDEKPLQRYGIAKTSSSSKIRDMFKSVLTRSSSGTVSQFKANLGAHLKQRGSQDSLSGSMYDLSRSASRKSPFPSHLNADPGVHDVSTDDDFNDDKDDMTVETDKFIRIPL